MVLQHKNLEREQAYRKLLSLILSGELTADAPLSERRLAETLGLGRTPTREAIKALVREGLLSAHPTRGTFIRQLSLQDVQEIYQVRFAIEGLAAFLAAERGASPKLREYGIAFQAALDAPDEFDVTELHNHGAEFHVEIFRNAGNRTLMEIYRPIRNRFSTAFGLPRYTSPDRVLCCVREHLDILKAIEDRDGERAQRMICHHLQKGLDFRTRLFGPADAFTPALTGRPETASEFG